MSLLKASFFSGLLLFCATFGANAQNLAALPPFYDAANAWVDSIMQSLSPEERIGQLFQVAAYSNRGPEHEREIKRLVAEYGIGGVIFFQGGPDRQARQVNSYQAMAQVPLLVSLDGEWGLGMRLDSTISFPYQMSLGAIQDDKLIYKMGLEIARQFKRIGLHVNFAPVVDVNNNAANPVINYRSFGEDKELVARKGMAYMHGLQDGNILTSAKHFPGHGDTDVDSHYDLPQINHDINRLRDIELYPFEQLMINGLGGVMVAHLNIPALDARPKQPSTLSNPIVTDLLQKELGFQGIVFTDALNMQGVAKYYEIGRVEVEALKAGNDALVFPQDVPKAIAAITAALKSGELQQMDIDRKCRKLLLAKYWLGLAEAHSVERQSLYQDLNTAEAHLLNRELVAASLTLIRNRNDILPFKNLESKRFLALSISKNGQRTDFQNMLGRYTKMDYANLKPDASSSQTTALRQKLADFDVLVVGLHQLQSRPRNKIIYNQAVQDLLTELSASGKAVIVALRNPYTLDKIKGIEKAEGILVAYQGNKVSEELSAQMLFGAIGSSGKLPVTINKNFPFGFGIETKGGLRLQYGAPEEVQWDGGWLEMQLDSIVGLGLEAEAFPGGVLLVAKNNKVVYQKAYGHHTYDKQIATKTDDIFDFASVTKITGPLPALMQLHGVGKFDLEAPMSAYWPDFEGSNKADLTWRNVLAHNARLKAWIPYWTSTVPWWNKWLLKKPLKFKKNTFAMDSSAMFPIKVSSQLYLHKDYRAKMYEAIKKSPLNEAPGYLYSGLSFYLYPDMITQMTGREYETYCKDAVYRKLGAYTITWNAWQHFPMERIVPTEQDTFFRQELLHGYVHDEGAAMMGGLSGNAGLFGTANDLAKIMQMYTNMGAYGGEQVIPEASMREFTAYQFREAGNRRGLGFDKPMLENRESGYVAPSASESSFGHSGYTGIFTWADPEEDLVIVFMSNRVHPTRLNRKVYAMDIYQKLHEICYAADRRKVPTMNK
ncbi:MAG: glycoside hydrolase family 3 N-terminal domain-containing protein [Bacteroidota bacterium]